MIKLIDKTILQHSTPTWIAQYLSDSIGCSDKTYVNLFNYYRRSSSYIIPWHLFYCPLNQTLFKNPVIAKDGITYEEEALVAYLNNHNNMLPNSCQAQYGPLIKPKALIRLLESEAFLEDWHWAYVASNEEKEKSDWSYVLDYFKDKKDGTKLPYSAVLDKKTNCLIPRERNRLAFLNKRYNTIHSYIKLEGEVYQLALSKSPGSMLGVGTYGTVKFVKDSRQVKSVAKIQTQDLDLYEGSEIVQEFKILKDLQLTKGRVKRLDKIKYYTQMPYLGNSLFCFCDTDPRLCFYKPPKDKLRANLVYLYLKNNQIKAIAKDIFGALIKKTISPQSLGANYNILKYKLEDLKKNETSLREVPLINAIYKAIDFMPETFDEDNRLEVGIAICLEVAYLQEGLLSLSGMGYAHLDLKPENILIDLNRAVHLVDYGFSEASPYDIRDSDTRGTEYYLPYFPRSGLVREQYDILALKRTLFLPFTCYAITGFNEASEDEHLEYSLLTREILNKYQLAPYLDTSSTKEEKKYFANSTINARTLAAILIVARLNLPISYQEIEKDKELAECLTDIYVYFEAVKRNRAGTCARLATLGFFASPKEGTSSVVQETSQLRL